MHASVTVTSADFRVGARRLTIRGYGPACEVFDYCDIGGALLAGDLETLEAAVAQRGDLLPALAGMLQSEAHVEIVRHSGQTLTSARTAALEALSGTMQGFTSPQFNARVATALRTGLSRSYFAGLLKGPVLALALPLLALPANWLAWRGHFAHHDFLIIAGVMLLTFGAAFASHLRVTQGLQRQLSPGGEANVREIVGKIGLTKKWLVVAAVATLLLAPVLGAIGRASAGF